jgi:hypothetical protein
MQSPFTLEVRRGVGAAKVLTFFQDDGISPRDVSGYSMTLKVYPHSASETPLYTYTLTAGTATNEKVVTFLIADVLKLGTFYAELDVNNPAIDGAYGFVVVTGR